MDKNPSSSLNDDNALVKKLIGGDSSAFEPLVKKYWNQVYYICLKYLKNPEVAGDAAQETFISAFTGIAGFDLSRNFRPWLFKIAVNRSLRWLKQDQAAQKISGEKTLVSQGSHKPDEIVGARQLFDDCIGRLDFDEQIMFILRHGLELSYDEMAIVLERPIGSVKGELFRARKKLKDMLENAEGKEVESGV